MRNSLLILFLTVLQVFANESYSQNTRLTLNLDDVTVQNVLDAIETQSEYYFLCNKKLVDVDRRVSINMKEQKIKEILPRIFNGTNVDYIVIDRQIVLSPSEYLNEAKAKLQNKTISGTVTDENGEPLPGITIVIKGTVRGAVTDVGGKYTIEVEDPSAVLVFSFVAYITQEVMVGVQTVIDIQMKQDILGLEEVIVVGYGTQRVKDLTGSISRVKGDEIMEASMSSFDQMIQGKVAGVHISQTSGAPGGNVNVLIRGISSITGGNQPLYVIDGFAAGTGGASSDMTRFGRNTFSSSGISDNIQNRINPLASVNPSDIESIEILKDASATAIYGSRGANGVIIITTKRGSAGKSQINVNVSYGVQEVANKIELMNSEQYAEFVAEGRDNAHVYAGGSASDPNEDRKSAYRVLPEFRDPGSLTVDTDWQDVIFRTAPVKNYQLSANWGNNKTKFFISGGYFDQEGVILTSDYKRFNLRTNIDAQITNRLKIGSSISGSHGYGSFPNTEGHYGLAGILQNVTSSGPTIRVYDDEGNPYYNQEDVTYALGFLVNPLTVLDGYSDDRKVSDILFNNFIEYKILDGLTFKSTFGVRYTGNVVKLWRSSDVPRYTTLNYPANAGATKYESINWLNENTLTYKHTFNEKHMFDALIGFTAQKDSYDRLSAGASDFSTNYVSYLSVGIVNAGTHELSEWSMLSFMSRVNYSYDGRYLLTATVRRDGSSRFGENHKWGNFPSISAGYNISEESFMESVEFINHLKIRASYGLSGNNLIGNYSHIGLLSLATYVENNSQRPGLVPSGMSNENLSWEKSKQINLGLDMSLFMNRISLTADVYRDTKTDLLLNVALPAASGFYSSTQNIGDIENKGVEIALQTVNVKKNKFVWTSNLIFSSNKNKVLRLATEGGRIQNGSLQVTEVGYPISSFYLWNAIGVFMNSAELDGAAVQHPNTQAGDVKFEDSNLDGTITADDKKIVGDPWPDFTWGFNNRFSYGSLALSIALYGSQGAYTYFNVSQNCASVQNQLALVDRRWKSEEDPGDGRFPRSIRNNYALNYTGSSSRYLWDASFIRIKNVNLSYTLPQKFVSRLHLSNMSVYFDIANLYTFTDYPGYDPESSTAGNNIVSSGIDYMTYPLPRTYTVGINLSF